MDGWRHLDATPRKVDSASGHGVEGRRAELGKMIREFKRRDDRGTVELRERQRIGDVILVGVGTEYEVARHGGGIDRAVRVTREPGI